MKNPKHILITGASGGLGAALALAYAAPSVRLSLQGRNLERLNHTAKMAELKGATVTIKRIDVTDTASMAEWIDSCDRLAPLDLVIANAGTSANTSSEVESVAITQTVFATNLSGVLNTIHPALPLMKQRKRGQVALVSSLAGFRGAPKAGAYCASKAAVRIYGEALRPELIPYNVELNVICPGFIKTPMTDANNFPMPFLMTPDKAALIIQRGLIANRARIAFPWPMTWLVKIYASLPAALIDRLFVKLPEKTAHTPP